MLLDNRHTNLPLSYSRYPRPKLKTVSNWLPSREEGGEMAFHGSGSACGHRVECKVWISPSLCFRTMPSSTSRTTPWIVAVPTMWALLSACRVALLIGVDDLLLQSLGLARGMTRTTLLSTAQTLSPFEKLPLHTCTTNKEKHMCPLSNPYIPNFVH
jgi:hypothetical protein